MAPAVSLALIATGEAESVARRITAGMEGGPCGSPRGGGDRFEGPLDVQQPVHRLLLRPRGSHGRVREVHPDGVSSGAPFTADQVPLLRVGGITAPGEVQHGIWLVLGYFEVPLFNGSVRPVALLGPPRT